MNWICQYGEETEITISASNLEEAKAAADELTSFRKWIPATWREAGKCLWVKGDSGDNFVLLWQI